MYHYVYRITNKSKNKHYYGARSSKVFPKYDLGKLYFSSSTDIDFIKEQKHCPNNFKYKIIFIFENREKTLRFEEKLHRKLKVDKNINFYNKAIQSFSGCDAHGYVTVKDNFDNTSRVKISDERYKNGELVPVNMGMVIAKINDKFVSIPKEEYYKNNHICNNTGKFAVKDLFGNTFLIEKDSQRIKDEGLIHCSTGLVTVIDLESGNTLKVTKEEFDNNTNYVGVNNGKVFGSKNPNAKIIHILDSNDKLMFECNGDFKQTCKINNLPFAALRDSYYNNSRRIFSTKKSYTDAINRGMGFFSGWYAKEIKNENRS